MIPPRFVSVLIMARVVQCIKLVEEGVIRMSCACKYNTNY